MKVEAPGQADARDHALATALLKRSDSWRAAMERARRLSAGRATNIADADCMIEDYRLLARDLAIARRLIPESRAREYLEAAYAQAHATVHKPVVHPLYSVWSLFRDQIPTAVSELRAHILWVTLLFVLSLLSGLWLVSTYPGLIGLFTSPELIATVERGELWTEGLLNVVPSSVLSIKLFTNNAIVSLFAFCAGFLFGLGTFYIVALNGLMLGAVFAFTALHGLDDDLFSFIVAHGMVELSVLCLSGAAGAAIGEALIRPSAATRGESFRLAASRAGKVLLACVLLLIGCGLIEGYISPDPEVPFWTRVLVGLGYWFFMLALLRGWLFGRGRVTGPVQT
jgi:uncharacterized membrane protein SpoIIM required for sporulation